MSLSKTHCWLFCALSACSSSPLSVELEPTHGPEQSRCTSDDDCDDGLVCSGLERCLDGRCWSGRPPHCDDGNACTRDLCLEPRGCRSLPSEACELDASATLPDAPESAVMALDASADDAAVPREGGSRYIARIPSYCGADLITGDVRASAQDTLDQLAGVRCIDGDLVVAGLAANTLAPLAALRWVGGDVSINLADLSSLTALAELEQVEGGLDVSGGRGPFALAAFARLRTVGVSLKLAFSDTVSLGGFAALTSVGGELAISLPALSDLSSAFPALKQIGAGLSLSSSKLLRLDAFNALVSLGGELKLEAPIAELSGFQSLERAGSIVNLPTALTFLDAFAHLTNVPTLTISAKGLREIHGFNALRAVPGALNLSGEQLERLGGFAALTEVGNLTLSALPKLTTLTAFTQLARVRSLTVSDTLVSSLPFAQLRECAALTLSNNRLLREVSALTGGAGVKSLTVVGNPELASLAPIAAAAEMDSVSIKENLTLVELGLAGLSSIKQDLAVFANPALPSCQADAIASKLVAARAASKDVCCNQGCERCEARVCAVPGSLNSGQSTRVSGMYGREMRDLRAYVNAESAAYVTLLNYQGPLATLPNLKEVSAYLEIGDGSWTDLTLFSALETIHGELEVRGTTQLRSLGLNRLRTIEGQVLLTGNRALADVALPALATVTGGFTVYSNPLLSICQLRALRDQLGSAASDVTYPFSVTATTCAGTCAGPVCQ